MTTIRTALAIGLLASLAWAVSPGQPAPGFSATDQTNGNLAYEEYVYGGISRSTSGGSGSWSCIQNFGGCSGCGICIPDNQTSFIAPVALDANNVAAQSLLVRSTLALALEGRAMGDKAAAKAALSAAEPVLMRASQKGIVHKKSAARKVSRLASRVKSMA